VAKRKTETNLPLPIGEIIADYRLAYRSRQASIVGRREVLSGKPKFGIFGDGKELPQVAMARAFRKGDWRSGYYRDQTWVHALGVLQFRDFFAQLYAHADLEADPVTAGRSMVGHFVSRFINMDGTWKDQTKMYNIAAWVRSRNGPWLLTMPAPSVRWYISPLSSITAFWTGQAPMRSWQRSRKVWSCGNNKSVSKNS
jgi:TPP-dependent pyruvate/acetoin dehydrogenase alpha subunit